MRTTHMSLSVTGALRQSDEDLKPWCENISVDGKKLHTVSEIRDFLVERLSEGFECIPMCECDNFDPKRGCLGHDIDELPEEVDGKA